MAALQGNNLIGRGVISATNDAHLVSLMLLAGQIAKLGNFEKFNGLTSLNLALSLHPLR